MVPTTHDPRPTVDGGRITEGGQRAMEADRTRLDTPRLCLASALPNALPLSPLEFSEVRTERNRARARMSMLLPRIRKCACRMATFATELHPDQTPDTAVKLGGRMRTSCTPVSELTDREVESQRRHSSSLVCADHVCAQPELCARAGLVGRNLSSSSELQLENRRRRPHSRVRSGRQIRNPKSKER